MGLSPRGRGNLHRSRYVTSGTRSIPAWAGEPSDFDIAAAVAMVYPRVGGGTWQAKVSSRLASGLSPRGRGNRPYKSYLGRWTGSIPAWAGEPPNERGGVEWPRVYPRVGGGTDTGNAQTWTQGGLSPRGRGNPIRPRGALCALGSIPAWAGEPRHLHRQPHPNAVYPRVGGGTPP